MKFLLIAIIFVFLPLSIPSGGNGSEEPPDKKPKVSCYFSEYRYGKGEEEESRTAKTAVSNKCEGEPRTMSTLDEETDKRRIVLFGAFSATDLTLNRGGAYYMKDLSEERHWKEQYICPRHIQELLTDWKDKVKWDHMNHGPSGSHVMFCSWPFLKHDKEVHGRHVHYVQREEARVYLDATSKHIHVGTPLCYDHHNEMMAAIHEYLEKMEDPDADGEMPVCAVSDSEECKRKDAFFEFAKMVGLNRPKKDFSSLKKDTQRKKVDGVMTVQKYAIHYVAPGHEDEVQAAVNARCSRGYTNDAEAMVDPFMQIIADEYLHAPTRRERDYVLSLVAGIYPHHLIARYVPNLSLSKFHRAQLIALSGDLHPPEIQRKLDRYDIDGILYLVRYIASSHVTVNIPSGSRPVTLSSGEIVDVPTVIRQIGHSEIVRGFSAYMRAHGLEDHLLSPSSIYRILRKLPADQRHSMQCVDMYKARAFYSFEDILAIIDRLMQINAINNPKHSKHRRDVLEIQLYLKTDFPLHLKESSLIAEHSFTRALSDPNEPEFRKKESHGYDQQCPRCNHMEITMRELEAIMKNAVATFPEYNKELREMQFRMKSHMEVITELKHHQIRSMFTDRERERIVNNLKPGEGLLTIDWAQKWEQMFYKEEQSQYYAKATMTWHFSHLLTKFGDHFATHVFIHLLDRKEEDSTAVVAILEEVLTDSKTMGVSKFHIRSDNAGCYHSSATIGSMQWLSSRTGTEILSYSFSESQHGKSSPDRAAGTAKQKMRRIVHTGKNVATLNEMFAALTAEPLMRGVSVHMATVKTPWKMPDDASKLTKITDYGHFEFTADTIRVWKYRGIGEGRIVPNMEAIEVELLVKPLPGGHAAAGITADYQKFLVENQIEAEFWHNDFNRKSALSGEGHATPAEETEDRDDVAATDHRSASFTISRDTLYHCWWCGAGFIRLKNRDNHMEWGQCKIIPEKVDIIDASIGAYKKTMEEIINQSPLLPLKDISDTIFDPSIPVPEEGFALRKNRRGGRLPGEARKFVVDYYVQQMRAGTRPEVDEALRLLTAEDSIPPEKRLTYNQIKSLFSRLSKTKTVSRARRHVPEDEEEELGEWEEDWDMGKEQEDLESMNYNFIQTNRHTLFDMSL